MLKVGIVGCGKIADGHVTQVRATGRAQVVAVCDQEPLMAGQLATRLNVPGIYSDLEEMIAREKLDVLHVATPPGSHLKIATIAFNAGCHVFMEKPFALNAPEARAIMREAERAQRRITVNYLYNFETPALELDALLARQALGDIVHLETAYGYNLAGDYGLAALSDSNHWVHSLPGKLFHNVLDHVLAKLVRFLRDDTQIQAVAYRLRPATGDPRVDAMPDELRFMLQSGATTAFGTVSAHSRPVSHTLRLMGTKDSVELDYAARTLIYAARQSQPSSLGRLFPPWIQARQQMRNGMRNIRLFRNYEFHYFQCMRVLLNRFYDSIESAAPEPISRDEIIRVCALIDSIVESINSARARA